MCWNMSKPLASAAEFRARFGRSFWSAYQGIEKDEYAWNEFDAMRCRSRRLFGALDAGVLDTDAVARLRPDAHPGADCLHLLQGPGPPDVWADLLLGHISARPPYRKRKPP